VRPPRPLARGSRAHPLCTPTRFALAGLTKKKLRCLQQCRDAPGLHVLPFVRQPQHRSVQPQGAYGRLARHGQASRPGSPATSPRSGPRFSHNPRRAAGLPDVERLTRKLARRRTSLADLCQLYRASSRLPHIEAALRDHAGPHAALLVARCGLATVLRAGWGQAILRSVLVGWGVGGGNKCVHGPDAR